VIVGDLVRIGVIGGLVAALVGGAATALGLDGPHALAVAGGVLALVAILLTQRSGAATTDPPDAETDPPPGGRRDLEELAWSMIEHRTHVRGVVLDRVGAIVGRRLAEHGLDPRRSEDGPAIEALLGAPAWAVLRGGRDRPVSPRGLETVLEAVERLPPPTSFAPDRPPQPDRTSHAD
jgi:hypothetical protein